MLSRRDAAALRWRTLDQAFSAAAAAHPRRPAVLGERGWLTYRQLEDEAARMAAGLRRLGARHGTRVAIVLPGGSPAAATFFAVARTGATAAFVNPALRARELGEALGELRPSIVIASQRVPGNEVLAALGEVHTRVGSPEVVVAGEAPGPPATLTLAGLMAADRSGAPAGAARRDDVAAILYTTGTTGQPKAVMHTHAGLAASIHALAEVQRTFLARPSLRLLAGVASLMARRRLRLLRGLGRQTWMTPLPLHSVAGFRLLLQSLLTGNSLVLMDRFHPRAALELIEREQVNVLAVAPLMLEAILDARAAQPRDLRSLLVVGLGSAPAPPALVRRARRELGCPVLNGYDAAETVGRAFPGIELRIVDEAGHPVPPGAVGETAPAAALPWQPGRAPAPAPPRPRRRARRPGPRRRLRPVQRRDLRALGASEESLADLAGVELAQVLCRRDAALAGVGRRLRDLTGGHRETYGPHALYESLLHMHHNRLIGPDRPHELLVTGLLARTLEGLERHPVPRVPTGVPA